MSTPPKNLTPLVSIVMPCYNDLPTHIDEALKSAFDQSYPNIEVILVDDGSTDLKTLSHLDGLDHKLLQVIHQENGGPSSARNRAIERSSGKYILPLDSDDKIDLDYVSDAVSVLESDETVPIVYGRAEYFGNKSGEMQLEPFSQSRLLLANMIFNSAVYRRSDFDRVGGYNENLVHGLEDHEMWLKICALGGTPVRLDKTVYYYRIRSSSRNHTVIRDRKRFVETRAEMFRANAETYAKNARVIFEEMDTLKEKIRYWEYRYGPLERIFERFGILEFLMMKLRDIVAKIRTSIRPNRINPPLT